MTKRRALSTVLAFWLAAGSFPYYALAANFEGSAGKTPRVTPIVRVGSTPAPLSTPDLAAAAGKAALPGASAAPEAILPAAEIAPGAAQLPTGPVDAPSAAGIGVPDGSPLAEAGRGAAQEAERVFREVPLAGPIRAEAKDAPATPPVSSEITAAKPAKKAASYDFAKMFDLTGRMSSRPEVRKFLREMFKEELTLTDEQQKQFALPEKIKEVSETQLMLMLQHNPQAWPVIEEYLAAMEKDDNKKKPDEELHKEWRERFRELLSDERIREVFKKFNDPLTPIRLDTPDGSPGYTNARIYANHQTIKDGKTLPQEDLLNVAIQHVLGADEDIMFDVFDFDSDKLADALIERAKAGVKVIGGIDKKVIAERPKVKAIFDKLNAQKGITVVAVDSVGLNHQKMIMVDYKNPKKAKVLFSSGNFTQSCIGPEGDLACVPAEKRPKDSVPNANHVFTADSYLLAQAAVHNMTKTLVYGLRGDEYPLGGAYRVQGAVPPGAKEAPWIIVTFAPKGGLGDINRDMTRRLILSTRGPLRLLQFAFSSEGVRDAIIERARLEKAEGRVFDFKSVGDTPFAVRPWSIFLELAGYALEESETAKQYVELAANALREVLGAEAYEAIRKNIRVGPRAYRNHHYKGEDGVDIEYGSKLHHKILLSGLYAIFGTSFNFSEAANHNQEQMLVTNDPALVSAMYAIFDGFFAMSLISLVEEVVRRNEFLKQGGDDDLKLDDQYKHVDEEAARSRKKSK